MDAFKQVSKTLVQIEEHYLNALELTQKLNQSIQENSLEEINILLAARAETIQAVEKLRNELDSIQKELLPEHNQINAEISPASLKKIIHPNEFRPISDLLRRINNILVKILEIDHDSQVRGEASLEKMKFDLRRVRIARNTQMAYAHKMVITEPRFIDKKK